MGSGTFRQSAFAFITVVFMSRRLQPEPTCTWQKQSQSGTKSPLVSLSITTQCNERLHNNNESGSVDFRFLLNQNKWKLNGAWTRIQSPDATVETEESKCKEAVESEILWSFPGTVMWFLFLFFLIDKRNWGCAALHANYLSGGTCNESCLLLLQSFR